MANLALHVENLGKMYRIGGKQERYATLRDTLTDAIGAPFKRARSLIHGEAYGAAGLKEEIWALKDVSFEVKHGEVVGIIGRNGAGKSTLLKILSRITEPTEGYAEVYGRVGSLLEVGTGFHPELTGRENIYLNGAILGMSREEISRKFDEIVDFAEIEKFIDTPVKHYSSGMGLRLGFAVAAHLEPEILVVDEVLAVGDAQFQKKCLGKMSDVAGEGRTVLFVSHNMAAVQQLCTRCVLLQGGKSVSDGIVGDIIKTYYQSQDENVRRTDLAKRTDRKVKTDFRFTSVELINDEGQHLEFAETGKPVTFLLHYSSESSDENFRNVSISIGIDDYWGNHLFTLASHIVGQDLETIPRGGVLQCRVPFLPLTESTYRGLLWCSVNGKTADYIEDAFQFDVRGTDVFGTGKLPKADWHGPFIQPHYWSCK